MQACAAISDFASFFFLSLQVWWSRDENHHSQLLSLSCDKGSHRHPCSAHKIPGKGMDIFLYTDFFIPLRGQRGANMLSISYIKIAPVSFKVFVTQQRNYKLLLLQSLGKEEEISRKNFCPLVPLSSIPEWRFFFPQVWARLLYFCLFWDRVSPCGSGCPRTHHVL